VKNICIKKPITSKENITSNFSQQSYCAAVAKMQQYILSGDIFEVNLSQCFKCDIADLDVYRLYQRLRYFNPAPFAAYTNLANIHLLSSSPERFLRLSGSKVEARPIKGTINRSSDINTDYQNIQQLLNSEKDKAENTMIVDLMRNDLSKVALPHSVIVEKLCGLESYANVHHLVSVITATLAPQVSAIELLKNTFPGGSITGAPKIRAMQIIAEIEPHTRGPYCGSMGYIGFNGEMDLSILIRTIIYQNGKVTFHGGGAVTLNSEPLHEYQESMAKVATLFQALVACCN
jgi:para-aminobenzoate synthetase component 1